MPTNTTSPLGPFVSPPIAAPLVGWCPTKNPGDSVSESDWFDISPYLIGVTGSTRGRQYELNQFQAGTATLVLDNTGRDFDRLFDSSSLGGLSASGTWTNADILPMRRFRISMFYSDSTGLLNSADYFNDPTNTNRVFPVFVGYAEGFEPTWEGTSYGIVTVQLSDAFRLLTGINVGATTDFTGGLGADLTYPATTLSGNIDNVVTTLTVASSSGFPTSGLTIQIDSEQMTVSSIAGTTWTVTRGANGTTAASHTSGAAVTMVTAGWLGAGASSTQIGAVLDAIGWPGTGLYSEAYARALDPNTDDYTTGGTIDNHQTNCELTYVSGTTTALSLMQKIADTEIGQLFVSGTGAVTFHDRAHRRRATRSRTAQGTFSDEE